MYALIPISQLKLSDYIMQRFLCSKLHVMVTYYETFICIEKL